MSFDSRQPCLLVLGSNPETAKIVEVARSMEIKTIVSNPISDSPAKRVADLSFDADPRNPEEIDSLIRRERVDGVMLGVSDPLVRHYYEICKRHTFPCFLNQKSVRAFSSKEAFGNVIKNFGLNQIHQYGVTGSSDFQLKDEVYPVVVKPVDSGAALGVSICESQADLINSINMGLSHSIRRQVVIEKAMMCDDLFAYYTFIDGTAVLTAIADRSKSIKQSGLPRVCLRADYPSKHLVRFLDSENSKLLSMFKSLDIRDGVLGIQFFFDGINFYAYDPGFRIQGEAPHHYIKTLFAMDQIKAAINFSLGLGYASTNTSFEPDPSFLGKKARTVWALGRTGVVESIQGLEMFSHEKRVVSVHVRVKPGDNISADMIGTERQVLARFHLLADDTESLDDVNRFVVRNFSVIGNDGVSMIQDIYNPDSVD